MTATLAGLQAAGAAKLAAAGIADAALDARLLLQAASGLTHAGLIARGNEAADAGVATRHESMLARRLRREPVSRIVGRREFFGLQFAITPDVLDPRPETELLVETVLADCADRARAWRFADIGTGSGAIAVALLRALPAASCVATDASEAALAVAAGNARRHGVADRLEARKGDLVDGLGGQFDFFTANLPYVPSGTIGRLEPEVRLFDPAIALDGGTDGLEPFRRLFLQLGQNSGLTRRVYLEIGSGQGAPIAAIASRHGWKIGRAGNDLAGIERVLVADFAA